jgi:hypothetical protein
MKMAGDEGGNVVTGETTGETGDLRGEHPTYSETNLELGRCEAPSTGTGRSRKLKSKFRGP